MQEVTPQEQGLPTAHLTRQELAARAREAAERIGSPDTKPAEKKGNFFQRGLGKLSGMAGGAGHVAGSVAHRAGDVLGGAKDLGTHLPHPHLPNVNVGGIKDAAGGALGGVGHLAAEGVKAPVRGVGKWAELSDAGGDALIRGMAHALENKKAFGKSVANFALHGVATRELSYGSRELAKGIVSWSGLAGAVGGGAVGTVVAGAFVGAMAGAAVEYARQVNKNLDRKAETDPSLAGRKAAFILKFKELRQTDTLTSIQWKKVRNAAIFGAIAGTGAAALVEHTQLGEIIRERLGGTILSRVGEVFGGAGSAVGGTVGNIGGGVGEAVGGFAGGAGEMIDGGAGKVGETIGDLAGGTGEMIGNAGGGVGGIVGDIAGRTGETIGDVGGAIGGTVGNLAGEAGGAIGGGAETARNNIPGIAGVGDFAGTVGNTTGNLLGGAGEMAHNIPGVQGAGDLAGNIPGVKGVGDLAGGIGHALGLGGVHEAGQTAAESAGQAAQEAIPTPDGFVPQADYNALNQQLTAAQNNINDLQRQLADAKQALDTAKGVVPVGDAVAAAANTATEQAAATAQSALDSLDSSISLQVGSNPWEVSTTILKQIGVANPTPEQIMQLDKVLCQENNVGVPAWGIKGTIDARNLPIGFNLNLTDAVKKTALTIVSKK